MPAGKKIYLLKIYNSISKTKTAQEGINCYVEAERDKAKGAGKAPAWWGAGFANS